MSQPIARCAVRVSIVRDEKQSPETQRDDMSRWCQRNGFQPVFYVDAEGYRSGRTADRPDFQRLLSDVEHKPTHAIVFWDVSRLARNNELAQWFYNICKDKKIRLVFVRNGLDFQFDRDDPFVLATSKLLFDVLAGTAEYYSNESSARLRANIHRLRHVENKHFGGIVPFGTDRVDGILVPTEAGCWWKIGTTEWLETFWNEEAQKEEPYTHQRPPGTPGEWKWRGYHDALRRAYELYASGTYGFSRTAIMLTLEGYAYRGHNGPRMFSGGDVNRLICMHLQYAGHLTKGATSQPSLATAEIIERSVWEPILPTNLIEQAAAVYDSRSGRRSGIHSPYRIYELSGILHCAQCEQKLRAFSIKRKRKYLYYRYGHYAKYKICTAKAFTVNAKDAEEAVMQHIVEHFDFEAQREDVAQKDPDALMRQGEEDPTDKRIRELEYSLAKLKDEYFAPGTVLSRDEFRERVVEIESEIAVLRDERSSRTLHAPLVFPDRLSEVLYLAEPEERREYYSLIVEAIFYDVDTGDISVIPRDWARPYYHE